MRARSAIYEADYHESLVGGSASEGVEESKEPNEFWMDSVLVKRNGSLEFEYKYLSPHIPSMVRMIGEYKDLALRKPDPDKPVLDNLNIKSCYSEIFRIQQRMASQEKGGYLYDQASKLFMISLRNIWGVPKLKDGTIVTPTANKTVPSLPNSITPIYDIAWYDAIKQIPPSDSTDSRSPKYINDIGNMHLILADLALGLRDLEAYSSLKKTHFDEARKFFLLLCTIDKLEFSKEKAEANLGLAKCYFAQNDIENAILHWKKANRNIFECNISDRDYVSVETNEILHALNREKTLRMTDIGI